MPNIVSYLGLAFYIYFNDHNPPHVHIHYGEFKLVIAIEGAELMEGYLPKRQRKLAQAVISKYKEEFQEKWELAQTGHQPGKIEVRL